MKNKGNKKMPIYTVKNWVLNNTPNFERFEEGYSRGAAQLHWGVKHHNNGSTRCRVLDYTLLPRMRKQVAGFK